MGVGGACTSSETEVVELRLGVQGGLLCLEKEAFLWSEGHWVFGVFFFFFGVTDCSEFKLNPISSPRSYIGTRDCAYTRTCLRIHTHTHTYTHVYHEQTCERDRRSWSVDRDSMTKR